MNIKHSGLTAVALAALLLGSVIPAQADRGGRYSNRHDRRHGYSQQVTHRHAPVVHSYRRHGYSHRPVVVVPVAPRYYHEQDLSGFYLRVNDGGTRIGIALGF